MQIPVLVEAIANNGYRARSGEPLPLTAEGATADEAVKNLRALISARLQTGAQLVSLTVAENDNPWLQGAGMFKDDPYFDDWQEEIAERRRQLDADSDVP